MGYRSQVALAVSKEIMPHFLSVLAKEPEARALIFKNHDHLDQDYCDPGTMLVAWHSIKWYSDSHAPIGAIQRFVDECNDDMLENFEVASEHIRFVRIGEESNDVEEKGTLHCYDICIQSTLSY